MQDDRVRRRVTVHGEVQGVNFRSATQEEAESEGVDGWVSNRDDGGVEVVLEGSPGAVDRVIDYLKTGPSQADVNDLDIEEEDPEGLSSFEVR